MRQFIFLLLCIGFTFAHMDLQYTDRFTSEKMTRCECEGVASIKSFMALIEENEGTLTSAEITARTYFNAISVNFYADVPEGASLQFEVSARDNSYNWSEWRAVQNSEGDIHFDNSHDTYRYRVVFTRSADGHSPKLHEVQISYDYVVPMMLQEETIVQQQSRGVRKPSIISRSDWGARQPKKGYSYHSPRKLTIHHTYRPLASNFKGSSTIRGIQNYHMDNNGWSDIGYHFLIGTYSSGSTVIYQGRPENVIGAHTGGANTNNVGVNLIGDYDMENVHPNGYKAMISTLAWLCDKYGISSNSIYGHKDFSSTLCPGRGLYDILPQIRRDVANHIARGGETEQLDSAATGTLIGAVYDSNKGSSARLGGATVTLSSGTKQTTGSDGIFRFQVSPGTYSYTVSKSGYKSNSSSRAVGSGETVWGSLGLSGGSGSPSKSLSGSHWVKFFPPSRQIKDLKDPFRGNMTRFYNALRSAGANVSISNTLRPPQRAFLMHWAYRIAKEGYNPRSVPAKSGVNIEWWHGSTSKSVSAARAMVSSYGIVYRPALSSNHIRGDAIDMSVTWSGTLKIKDANGRTVSIGSPRSGASNRTLWSVGKTYGVLKLASDAPHWSRNGR
ncbi:N-acetylmuramoyl-L-alanine amidase [Candidatus Uabimicrobium sp. HlEnr_7]|uniref:N-acetylmuramoyl-L-alanine amidase n=1 Tax=Candidatus Uabimicrobium helgolandensis TaxID=3095367 RepID=UPI003555E874